MGLFFDTDPEPKHGQHRYSPPPDNDTHRFDELLDELDCPVNTDDYNATPLLEPVEPTFSACGRASQGPQLWTTRSSLKNFILVTMYNLLASYNWKLNTATL